MSELFGQEAARICSLAAQILGWKPDDFWNATPAEMDCAFADPRNKHMLMDRATLSRLLELDENGR